MSFRHCPPCPQMRVMAWNACDLNSKVAKLSQFLRDDPVDALLVNETWLRPGDRLTFPNYRVYRNNRLVGRRGGTAILIRQTTKHSLVAVPALRSLEATSLDVEVRGLGPLRLIAVYAPPSRVCDTDDYDRLFACNAPVLLAGDLNAKHPLWGCSSTNEFGSKVFRFLSLTDVEVHSPDVPTYFRPGTRPDILDIALTRGLPSYLHVESAPDLSSDHNPIYITFGGELQASEAASRGTVDWERFMASVRQSIDGMELRIDGAQSLEASAERITGIISQAVGASTSASTPAPDKWLPDDLRHLLRRKRKARKVAQTTLSPADTEVANHLSARLRAELKIFREKQWWRDVSSAIPDDGSLWRLSKALKRRASRTAESVPLLGPAGPAHSAADKVALFADHLQSVFPGQGGQPQHGPLHREADLFLHQLPHMPGDALDPAGKEEVLACISLRKNGKAPGADGIANTALKRLPSNAIDTLVTVLNAMLSQRIFPSIWKHANVVMIHKRGKDHRLPTSYRSISLLSNLSKIAEAIILSRLRHIICEGHFLPDEQFGFGRACRPTSNSSD